MSASNGSPCREILKKITDEEEDEHLKQTQNVLLSANLQNIILKL